MFQFVQTLLGLGLGFPLASLPFALLIVPAWLCGFGTALFFLAVPRNQNQQDKDRSSSPSNFWAGLLLSRRLRSLAVLYHLGLILREVWVTYTTPGLFRAFALATWHWICGNGFDFQPPAVASLTSLKAQYYSTSPPDGASLNAALAHASKTLQTHDVDAASCVEQEREWYVGQDDLGFFQYSAEQDGDVPGASPWEQMMYKDIPNQVLYTSWRRTLPNGKTEYRSITYSPDSTAEEFIDLYFDDAFRPTWDTMIVHREVLEHGDFDERQQVVRWIRRFPFKFLSDREYAIARRLFRVGEYLYGITKSVPDHPAALRARDESTTRMDIFYSMWRSRTVACPWGSGKPACETLLLHHEQFKIPERLARFAVSHGMWGFVSKLAERVPVFVADRRARGVPPDGRDPMAFGSGHIPNPQPSPLPSPPSFSLKAADTNSQRAADSALSSPTPLSRAVSYLPPGMAEPQGRKDLGGSPPMHLSGSTLSLASLESFTSAAGRSQRNPFMRHSMQRQSTGGMPHNALAAASDGRTTPAAPLALSTAVSMPNPLLGSPQPQVISYGPSMSVTPGASGLPSGGGACVTLRPGNNSCGASLDKATSASGSGSGRTARCSYGENNKGVKRRGMRGLLAMAMAGGAALILRSSSAPNLASNDHRDMHPASEAKAARRSGYKALKQRHQQQRRLEAGGLV